MKAILFVMVMGWASTQSCSSNSIILKPSTSLSNTLSTLPQTDLQNNFKQYLYDRSSSNLSTFVMSLKPYIIPIIILMSLQILCLLYIVGMKIYRCRRPDKAQPQYTKVGNVITLLTTGLLCLGIVAAAVVLILTAYSASSAVANAECLSSTTVSNFLNGESGKWLGVSNVAAKAGNVSLQFNNNVRQLKTGLTGLKINGTLLGIPTATTIESTVTAVMSNYLVRNTSANAKRYPVCQTTPITVPNPADNTTTVTLSYQSTMCSSLTNQSNTLILAARSLDNMSLMLTNLTGNRSNINNNVTAISTAYNSFVNSSNFYKLSLSTLNLSIGTIMSYVLAGVMILFAILLLSMFISRSQKYFKAYPLIYVMLLGLGGLTTAVNVYYVTAAASVQASCGLYDSSLSNSSLYTEIADKLNVKSTLDPVYFCVNNPTSTFLNSSQMAASFVALQNLTALNNYYKSAQPDNILNSKAINFTTDVLNYLNDLSTMPISNGSVAGVITNLNRIGDYTYPNSTQSPICNKSQDQFVFNPTKCTRTLLDPTNATDVTTNSPRCIQLPTNNRTSGTVNTSLNSMQHLFDLSATGDCVSEVNIFNPTKNCFLKTRATALFGSCPAVFTSYTNQIQMMVQFSTLAGEYTDAFAQNLRNYLGNYLGVSSNISAFYLSTNVSQMVSSFATDSLNIASMSNCSYPSDQMKSIKTQYCENVTPAIFQVWVVGFAGMAGLCLLTMFAILSESRLGQIIASSKVMAKAKVGIESALGYDRSMDMSVVNHTEENVRPGRDNILLENVDHVESRSMRREEIGENHKEQSVPVNSTRRDKDNVLEIHSDEKRSVSQVSEPLGVRKLQKVISNKGSVKPSEHSDKQKALYIFQQSNSGKMDQSKQQIIEPERDEIINIDLQQQLNNAVAEQNLEEKFNFQASGSERHSDAGHSDKITEVGKHQYTTEASEYKEIVYNRNIKNIILASHTQSGKFFKRSRPPRPEPHKDGKISAMSINDFGLMGSDERQKSEEEDNQETTTKKKQEFDSSAKKLNQNE